MTQKRLSKRHSKFRPGSWGRVVVKRGGRHRADLEDAARLSFTEEWLVSLVPKNGGLRNFRGDEVGVHVGGGPPVLEVALAIGLRRVGDPHRRPAVGDAVRELLDRGRLVRAGQ